MFTASLLANPSRADLSRETVETLRNAWGGGALRWLKTDDDARSVRVAASKADGHATLFRRGAPDISAFHPLPEAMMRLHRRVKQAMDPAGILNSGRMYPGL